MTDARNTIAKGGMGILGAAATQLGEHSDSLYKWGPWVLGAIASILMIANLVLDFRRKWKERNKP